MITEAQVHFSVHERLPVGNALDFIPETRGESQCNAVPSRSIRTWYAAAAAATGFELSGL